MTSSVTSSGSAKSGGTSKSTGGLHHQPVSSRAIDNLAHQVPLIGAMTTATLDDVSWRLPV